DPTAYSRMIVGSEPIWSDVEPGVMTLKLESRSPDQDHARMEALLLALYEVNRRDLDSLNNRQKEIKDLELKIAELKHQISRKRDLIASSETADPAAPAVLEQKKRQVEQLLDEWNKTLEAVAAARQALDRLRAAQVAAPGGA